MSPIPLCPQIPEKQTIGLALMIPKDPPGSCGTVISFPDVVLEDLNFSSTSASKLSSDLELITSPF